MLAARSIVVSKRSAQCTAETNLVPIRLMQLCSTIVSCSDAENDDDSGQKGDEGRAEEHAGDTAVCCF